MIETTDAEQIERLNSRVAELLRERDALVQAVTSAMRLIGATNDTASAAVKESNINTAWHVLDDALASLKERP